MNRGQENLSFQIADFTARAEIHDRNHRMRRLQIASVILSLVILALVAVNFAVQP